MSLFLLPWSPFEEEASGAKLSINTSSVTRVQLKGSNVPPWYSAQGAFPSGAAAVIPLYLNLVTWEIAIVEILGAFNSHIFTAWRVDYFHE